ncbi:MAG: hypothetical protein ABSA23_10065 [Anaerolineales bacterium]
MNKGLAYNIIQSKDLWKGDGIFRRLFEHPLVRVQMGSIPPALQRATLMMASVHNVEAAGIFENSANSAISRAGRRNTWFLLQAGHTRLLAGQVPLGIPQIQQG